MLVAAFNSFFLGFGRSQNRYEDCITKNCIVLLNHEENVSKKLKCERIMRMYLYKHYMYVIKGVTHRGRQFSA